MTVGELIAELQAAGFNDAQIVTVVTLASRYASRSERDGRSPEAERARRYRAAKSAKTVAAREAGLAANVTTTSHDARENAPLSKKESDSQLSIEKKRKKESDSVNGRARGSRLPDNWTPSDADWSFAAKLLRGDEIEIEATKFRNYWTNRTDRQASKPRWDLAWQNWILNGRKSHGQPKKTSNTELAYELAEQFEREADFRRTID